MGAEPGLLHMTAPLRGGPEEQCVGGASQRATHFPVRGDLSKVHTRTREQWQMAWLVGQGPGKGKTASLHVRKSWGRAEWLESQPWALCLVDTHCRGATEQPGGQKDSSG